MRLLRAWFMCGCVLFALFPPVFGAAPDSPFTQAVSRKFPLPAELRGQARKICVDQDGIVYILTSRGVARLFEDRIAMDGTYRPLAGKIPIDIAVGGGKLYYLFPDELVCNRDAGKLVVKLPRAFERLAVNNTGEVLLWSPSGSVLAAQGTLRPIKAPENFTPSSFSAPGLFAFSPRGILDYENNSFHSIEIPGVTSMLASSAGNYCGTTQGLVRLDLTKSPIVATRETHLPASDIRVLASHGGDLWAATSRGVWKRAADGTFRYFASRRWLDSDDVVDVQVDPRGNAWALTQTGLNKIEFQQMTLAQKAQRYEEKIRQRHIRYGFCAELHLRTPGDIATAEMIDTDNDGTWSNYYMASQAFRFGATGDEQARRNAWETFAALERLEEINPLHGFPSRTFERTGFKVSDPDRWRPAGDGLWEWKGHTSSDEFTAHMFGCAVLYETTARTDSERERIATFVRKILDHIISHNWYLVDVDGQPTLWGRWNPEYVNAFPESVYDRRLNSAEIIAALQFGFKITGRDFYRDKALQLMKDAGYLRNIEIPMSRVADTPGVLHQGIDMGNEWNHSDDLLGFVTYWTLHRFALTDELRSKYRAVIRDHWQIERAERCPLWNFVYASTGANDFGLDEGLWTLRGFPMDTIDWSVDNSRRGDITRLPKNFRGQELAELLPPDERRITRWNSQPFVLSGGNGGSTELAGDEFLLPYWMARYLRLLE